MDDLTVDNLVEHLRGMQEQLSGIGSGFFEAFGKEAELRLSETDRDEAGALLRGTLMLCTALHEVLDGTPTLLGFGFPHVVLLANVLAAIDPSKLSPNVLDALAGDLLRIIGDLDDLPRDLVAAIETRLEQRCEASQ